ncbi:MAG: ATP-dependent sacrificial sulfur transferase LarE [Planctomycetota bacterium]|jgi:uncharacterized protein
MAARFKINLNLPKARSVATQSLDDELDRKLHACKAILEGLGSVVVAFSGGADSALLLALSIGVLGEDNVLAVIGTSPSLPRRELEAGRRIARHLGARVCEIATDELSDPHYAANPPERCYYCKNDLFTRLQGLAAEQGYRAVVSGANADDCGDFRPGLQAGEQLGIRNPLMEAGLTKCDVRTVSSAMKLETWDKPASACLASRVPYGDAITPEKLSRIERAEYILKDLGFAESRIRHHNSLARIEVPASELSRIIELREQIVTQLVALGYTYVSLDLQGFRSGSMNEVLIDR